MKNIILSFIVLGGSSVIGSQLFETTHQLIEKKWGLPLINHFSQLPEMGEVSEDKFPFSGSSFEKNGILSKQNEINKDESLSIKKPLLTLNDLNQLSEEELRKKVQSLSAAEKFDLLRGRFDYPLTREEEKRLKLEEHPEVALLRGWSLAATTLRSSELLKPIREIASAFPKLTLFLPFKTFETLSLKEPSPSEAHVWISQSKKIAIPFQSSDVKSLIAYYIGVRAWSQNSMNQNIREIGSIEHELSAKSFHQILTNTVGIQKAPLSFSFYEDGQKKYEPIVKYESNIRLERTENGESQYLITTDYYSLKPSEKSWRALSSLQNEEAKQNKHLRHSQSVYRLKGEQSEWIDGTRPSSLIRMNPVSLNQEFEKLGEIYNASHD